MALGAAPGSLAELIERITQRSAAELAPEASLAKDLNLSSLERVELMGAIEDRYQVELNEARFTAATTVGELETMLRQPGAERTKFHYPRWAQAAWLAPIRFLAYYLLAWPATALLAHPRVRGRERVRNVRPPVLIICNHVTYVDIGFVLFALPPHLRRKLAVAMEGERVAAMRNPSRERGLVMGWLDRIGYWLMTALFGVFPLPARAGFRRSFGFIGESVDRGYSVLVLPEGMRTRDGTLGPFRTGIGLLVNNLKLPVVPMRIDGLWEVKQAGRRTAPPGAVRITVGVPVKFDDEGDPVKIAEELRRIVGSL